MKDNANLKLNRYLTIMLGITFVLSVFVIYQANTINELKNKQTTKFFLEAKLNRDQSNVRTLQSLKALIDDENVSKECKESAASKYINIASAANSEASIELILKSKGYEDTLSTISDDRVSVVIKHGKKLSNKQLNEIRDIVISVTKIKDTEVVTK